MYNNQYSNGCLVSTGILFIVISAFIIPWVYGYIILILSLIMVIWGLIKVYLTYSEVKVSEKKREQVSFIKRCPTCGNQVGFINDYCTNCGVNL